MYVCPDTCTVWTGYVLLYWLPMLAPNTETGYVSYSVEIVPFKIKFEITVFKINSVSKLNFWY